MNYAQNPDFESGTWDDWEIHYATVGTKKNKLTGKFRRFITWDAESPAQPLPEVVHSLSKLPQQAAAVVPFQGARMLRINDLVGDYHVTCAHQTITLPASFNDACASISFAWGALLGGSGHTGLDRPRFSYHVCVKRKSRWKEFLGGEFFAPSGGGDGWVDVRAAGQQEAVWFKSGVEKRPLYGLKGGDTIRVRFVAEDCTHGAHGGAGFIDDLVITNGCSPSQPVGSPIPQIVVPNVFTPNGDGVNDVWGLNGVAGACKIDLYVYDRWGDLVFTTVRRSFDGTWPPFEGMWNGLIRTRRRTKGIGKRKKYYWRMIRASDMQSMTVFYVLSLTNCFESASYNGFITIFV